MQEALYRKYRPDNLKSLVGQPDAVTLIEKQIEKVLNLPPQTWGFSREDIVENLEEVMENMENIQDSRHLMTLYKDNRD